MKVLAALLLSGTLALAEEPAIHDEAHLSTRNEIGLAIDKGFGWLLAQQQPDGAWSDPARPGLTAEALRALLGNPQAPTDRPTALEATRRAIDFLRAQAKPDGGLYQRADPVYQTALCVSGLLSARQPADADLVKKARAFLADRLPHDALTASAVAEAFGGSPPGLRLAHEEPTGAKVCAALSLAPSAEAEAWLNAHDSVTENPGAGADGYYGFLLRRAQRTMTPARALAIALALINRQSSAGSWVNEHSARGPEDDPVLVTAYALRTLEIIWRQL